MSPEPSTPQQSRARAAEISRVEAELTRIRQFAEQAGTLVRTLEGQLSATATGQQNPSDRPDGTRPDAR